MRLSYNSGMLFRSAVIFFVSAAILYAYFRWPFYSYLHNPEYFWLWLLGLFIVIGVFSRAALILGNRIRGFEGEQDVNSELQNLPTEFISLYNLVLGDQGNIDQVVIGPTGIWAIETKSHEGNITFRDGELVRNGQLLEKDFLNQAWAEACAVRDVLKQELHRDFKVQPVLVFSGDAKLHFGMHPLNGVYVIGINWLDRLIANTMIEPINSNGTKKIAETLNPYVER